MTATEAVTERWFAVDCQGRTVPALAWSSDTAMPCPLVLVGHGGGGSKEAVAPLAETLVRHFGATAVAIDGPVHGERRGDAAPREVLLEDFRALWRNGTPRIDEMVSDWTAVLDHVVGQGNVDTSRIAWCGLSMGTAYGLPFVAAHPELAAAALGMWGLSYPSSERLAADAPKVRCPVLFQRKAEDALFTVEGQEELFALLGSDDKRLSVHPGPHETSDRQVDEIVAFLASHLTIGERT